MKLFQKFFNRLNKTNEVTREKVSRAQKKTLDEIVNRANSRKRLYGHLPRCVGCGDYSPEVEVMIYINHNVSICNECIGICDEIITEHLTREHIVSKIYIPE